MAEAIFWLDFSPKVHPSVKTEQHNWMVLAKCWCAVENSHENSNPKFTMDLNHVFANHSDEEEIYPLTVSEISEGQLQDKTLQHQKGLMKY